MLKLLAGRPETAGVESQESGALVTLSAESAVSRLVTFLVRLGVELEEVTPVGNTLEDGVLSLFGEAEATRTPQRRSEPGPLLQAMAVGPR